MADDVKVDLEKLRKYGLDMLGRALKPTTEVARALTPMRDLVGDAFTKLTSAGTFAEGAVVSGIVTQHMSDFQNFAADVAKGMRYMSDALGVIAVTYQNTDVSAAADVDLARFAFGGGGPKPKGYTGDDLTYVEKDANDAAAAGAAPIALTGDISKARHLQVGANIDYYTFSDNSYLMVTTAYDPKTGESSTTTVVVGADGKAIRTTTKSQGTNELGQDVRTTTQTAPGGATTTTTITRDAQGGLTVNTTITDPQGHTSQNISYTPPDPHHANTEEQGPVEHYQDKYDTPGEPDTVRRRGIGY